MNDTTRDELIERIAELADQFACGAAGEPVVYALHGPMDFAEEVIELVTAARDAEPDAARKLSVTFACGSQEYWDLEPDGSIHLDIRQDQAVVSSDHLSEPDDGVKEIEWMP